MNDYDDIVAEMDKMLSGVQFVCPPEETLNRGCVIHTPGLVAGKDWLTLREFMDAHIAIAKKQHEQGQNDV